MGSRTELTSCSQLVQALYRRLDELFVSFGLTPAEKKGGVAYGLGRHTPYRVDFKVEFLRINVGTEDEVHAPSPLRGDYVQRGWIIVRPEHADVAADYLRLRIPQRLRDIQGR